MLRYIVERISDGAFLELELPINVSSAGKKKCGPGKFSGEIMPVVEAYRYAGTNALIEPRGTFIHEEADGQIRGTWIVTRSEFEGARWRIEGAGYSSYFNGYPYEGEYWGVQVDPIAAARHVITYIQGRNASNIGVTLTGSSSKRVGTDSDLKADAAKKVMDAKKKAWDEFAKPRKTLEAEVKKISKPYDDAIRIMNRDRRILFDDYAAAVAAKKPKATIDAKKAPVDAKDKEIKTKRDAKAKATKTRRDKIDDLKITEEPLETAFDAAKEDYEAAKDKATDDAGAWKMLWWDTPDAGKLMTEAIEEAGYEWVEWSGWNADKTKILKEIRCVPTVGRKREDLSFIEGDNVLEVVAIKDDSADYANSVTVIGAGEGKSALRFEVGIADGRRRTPVVIDAKHLTRQTAVENLARVELARRQQKLKVAAVRVDASHANAPRGTFDVGDIIPVDTDGGWTGRRVFWRRIEEIEWIGLETADLILEDA
ncbi:hypothetical protein G7068_03270 [Leucobacter viscericola]|uniref:Virus ReqiPepy6 Gp37-like protein n=1 Tax=Leucobacter viscericola TaxID=2714935 RepID=A0A6G7XCP7_9MICO|nr:hypothetical protein [Leucobacter viscericola]QIK62335.1 hypothetical protein G7068_03270 [Leucobacter viscericola]